MATGQNFAGSGGRGVSPPRSRADLQIMRKTTQQVLPFLSLHEDPPTDPSLSPFCCQKHSCPPYKRMLAAISTTSTQAQISHTLVCDSQRSGAFIAEEGKPFILRCSSQLSEQRLYLAADLAKTSASGGSHPSAPPCFPFVPPSLSFLAHSPDLLHHPLSCCVCARIRC